MRRAVVLAVVLGVAGWWIGAPTQARPVSSEIATDPCPGDTAENTVPLPAWSDLCSLSAATTSVDGALAVAFSIRLAGEVQTRPSGAVYRMNWNVPQSPAMEWTYPPYEQLLLDSGLTDPRPDDHCTQVLTFDQTHNSLDHVTGTWRATVWDRTCPAWGTKSRYTELPPDRVSITDDTITIIATSPHWAPSTKLQAITVETGFGLLTTKGDTLPTPPEEGHFHLGEVELPADRAVGRDFVIGR